MKNKTESLETKEETIRRIEWQRLSIMKFKAEPVVARSGTFFDEKVITLKEVQQMNNQPLRNKL